MKTRIHYYRIDTSTKAGKAKYDAMLEKIKADRPDARGHWLNAISDRRTNEQRANDNTTEDIEIETACLFDNQWNTAPTADSENGLRVFDHWEEIRYADGHECAPHIKIGHWVEITDQMAAARHDTRKCGYCGKHYGPLHEPAPEDGFCRACLDSPYLKEGELHLLRLARLSGPQNARAELTEDERATLLPLYVERQTTGADSRAKARRDKQRKRVIEEYEKDTNAATTERDGMLWLWDHGFDLDNVIYYKHSDTFGFGWRSPLSSAVASKLLDIISEFPFRYEIKAEGGKSYSNAA